MIPLSDFISCKCIGPDSFGRPGQRACDCLGDTKPIPYERDSKRVYAALKRWAKAYPDAMVTYVLEREWVEAELDPSATFNTGIYSVAVAFGKSKYKFYMRGGSDE